MYASDPPFDMMVCPGFRVTSSSAKAGAPRMRVSYSELCALVPALVPALVGALMGALVVVLALDVVARFIACISST
jgi:hypothetical protein